MKFTDSDKKYIIRRVITFLIISFISYFMFSGCVKASVVSRYMCNESGGSNSCDYTMQATNTWSELPLYYMGDNRPFFANAGQGYVNFSFIAWGYSGTYNLPIYSVQLISDLDSTTGNSSLFACDIGTYSQYHDNNNNYVVYSVKCPVSIGSRGLYSIRVSKYSGDETLLIKRGSIITFTSDIDVSNAINSSAQNIANQQMQNETTNANNIIAEINRDMYGVQARLDNYGSQAHQDSQAINNSINSTDSDDTSASCGIICKLKSIVSFLKPSNLIHLVVPSQQDWQDVINNALNTMRNKLGVLGLVLSIVYNFFAILIGQFSPNYCFEWQGITVPNFEDFTIIQAGQFCLDTYFGTGILKTFHDTCVMLVGGLLVFAFIGYCRKCYKRLLDVPITRDDEYEYISTGTSYDRELSDGARMNTWSRHSYRVKR